MEGRLRGPEQAVDRGIQRRQAAAQHVEALGRREDRGRTAAEALGDAQQPGRGRTERPRPRQQAGGQGRQVAHELQGPRMALQELPDGGQVLPQVAVQAEAHKGQQRQRIKEEEEDPSAPAVVGRAFLPEILHKVLEQLLRAVERMLQHLLFSTYHRITSCRTSMTT